MEQEVGSPGESAPSTTQDHSKLFMEGHKLVSSVVTTKEDIIKGNPTVKIKTNSEAHTADTRTFEIITTEESGRRLVVNNRTFNAALGDDDKITNGTKSVFIHDGKDAALNDTATWNICGGKGGISNSGSVITHIGSPPDTAD